MVGKPLINLAMGIGIGVGDSSVGVGNAAGSYRSMTTKAPKAGKDIEKLIDFMEKNFPEGTKRCMGKEIWSLAYCF